MLQKYDMITVILTLKRPIFSCLLFASAAYIQVCFWLEFIMVTKKMNPDQTAPLIWVHIVCNIGYCCANREWQWRYILFSIVK